jgi:hypothetical protein
LLRRIGAATLVTNERERGVTSSPSARHGPDLGLNEASPKVTTPSFESKQEEKCKSGGRFDPDFLGNVTICVIEVVWYLHVIELWYGTNNRVL